MNILLINPSSTLSPFLPKTAKIPYGIAYIAAVLEKEGYNVSIWDRNVDQMDIKTVLKREQPDIIGFSVMTGHCILDAIEISQEAKAIYPDVSIVWGGYHPTLLPEQTLAEEYIDYVAYGEGEYTMLELVDSMRNNSPIEDVDGVYFKKGGKTVKTQPRSPIKDLDQLPFPAWHLFEIKKYIRHGTFNEREINLNTSRGCPFNCSFCCEPAFHKRRWRANSSRRVIEMVKHLKSEYGCNHIAFRDSLFTANLRRLEEICDALITEGLKMGWHCPARIMNWDKVLLKKMKQAGCTYLEFGVETGSPRLLKLLNKRITFDLVYQTFKKCNEIGITPRINLIIGLPTEKRKDLDMTLALLDRLNPSVAGISIFMPYPACELHDFVVRQDMFVSPATLRDWAKIDDPYAPEFPSFGEVAKDELWQIIQEVRNRNIRIARKQVVRRLLKNPTKVFSYVSGLIKRLSV